MTNLSSVLKNTDITFPTNVCVVKAMVFPVTMYGCESWIIKRAGLESYGNLFRNMTDTQAIMTQKLGLPFIAE